MICKAPIHVISLDPLEAGQNGPLLLVWKHLSHTKFVVLGDYDQEQDLIHKHDIASYDDILVALVNVGQKVSVGDGNAMGLSAD